MTDPILSVIVPAYNVADYILPAVRSALGQGYRDLEVVVVDDGSTDGTGELLRGAVRDPRLVVVRQRNAGLAAARNTALRHARGRYVGLLDGDDLWRPGKAERQVAVLEARPEVTLTYSDSEYLTADGRPTGRLLQSRGSSPGWMSFLVRNHVGNGSTPILRRADLLAVGGFDERLRTAMEDYEAWPRLLRASGRQAWRIPEPLTGYRVRDNSLSMDFAPFLRQAEMARDLLAEKLPDAPPALLALGLAQTYRIAARKAAALGRRPEALRYLRAAVRIAPSLPLRDPRFLGTAALVAMGPSAQGALHGALQGLLSGVRR